MRKIASLEAGTIRVYSANYIIGGYASQRKKGARKNLSGSKETRNCTWYARTLLDRIDSLAENSGCGARIMVATFECPSKMETHDFYL